ncbi:DNA methyltransferase [Leucobacter sp. 1207-22]|uniref:DNA methyltransferase n=1 Tax=Leucobacter sp. 1207-22 TaxID=2604456 RepID=UPI004063B596
MPETELTSTGYEDSEELWQALKDRELAARAGVKTETDISSAERRSNFPEAEVFAAADVRAEGYRAQIQAVAEEAVALVRERNIFPIIYYSTAGAELEVLKCVEHGLGIDRRTKKKAGSPSDNYAIVSSAHTEGADLCRWMFPQLFDVGRKGGGKTWFQQFQQIHEPGNQVLVKTLQRTGLPKNITSLRGRVRNGKPQPTNFYPMAAQEIYRRWAPEGGVVWDMSCGFGGRMLGALTSPKQLTYVGTDPASETFHNLGKLGELIESVTGRRHSYELHKAGSEKDIGLVSEVDFAFTSPPYWNLEWYETTDKKQSLEEWFDNYVVGTIDQVFRALKPGARYAVNIADFDIEVATGGNGGKGSREMQRVNYVDRWVSESISRGFRFIRQDSLELTADAKTALQNKANNATRGILQLAPAKKSEPLLHFYKPHTLAR